jgi:hypothetical protein
MMPSKAPDRKYKKEFDRYWGLTEEQRKAERDARKITIDGVTYTLPDVGSPEADARRKIDGWYELDPAVRDKIIQEELKNHPGVVKDIIIARLLGGDPTSILSDFVRDEIVAKMEVVLWTNYNGTATLVGYKLEDESPLFFDWTSGERMDFSKSFHGKSGLFYPTAIWDLFRNGSLFSSNFTNQNMVIMVIRDEYHYGTKQDGSPKQLDGFKIFIPSPFNTKKLICSHYDLTENNGCPEDYDHGDELFCVNSTRILVAFGGNYNKDGIIGAYEVYRGDGNFIHKGVMDPNDEFFKWLFSIE